MDYIKMNRKLLEVLRARMENKMDIHKPFRKSRVPIFLSNRIFILDVGLWFPRKLEIYEDRPGVVVIGLPLGSISGVTVSLNVESSLSRCFDAEYVPNFLKEHKYKDKSIDEINEIIDTIGYLDVVSVVESIMTDLSKRMGKVPVQLKLSLSDRAYPINKRRDILPLVTFDFTNGIVYSVNSRSANITSPGLMYKQSISGVLSGVNSDHFHDTATLDLVPLRLLDSEIIFDEYDLDLHYKGEIKF